MIRKLLVSIMCVELAVWILGVSTPVSAETAPIGKAQPVVKPPVGKIESAVKPMVIVPKPLVVPAPTGTLRASQQPIKCGESVDLTWSVQNTSNAFIVDENSNQYVSTTTTVTSDKVTVKPIVTTTYSLYADKLAGALSVGDGRVLIASVKIDVSKVPPYESWACLNCELFAQHYANDTYAGSPEYNYHRNSLSNNCDSCRKELMDIEKIRPLTNQDLETATDNDGECYALIEHCVVIGDCERKMLLK